MSGTRRSGGSALLPAVDPTTAAAGRGRPAAGGSRIKHRKPVAGLEVEAGAVWKSLRRTGYNCFLFEEGTGCGAQGWAGKPWPAAPPIQGFIR